jgi:hypothetical protein
MRIQLAGLELYAYGIGETTRSSVAHAGLKPRASHRVARLRRIVDHIHAVGPPSWARIAPACGYFDQAHLINEFRLLSGITSGEYVAAYSSVGRGFVAYRLAGKRWKRIRRDDPASRGQPSTRCIAYRVS